QGGGARHVPRGNPARGDSHVSRAEFGKLGRQRLRRMAWPDGNRRCRRLATAGTHRLDRFARSGHVSGYAFDSCIVIDLLLGIDQARAEFERALERRIQPWISRVVWLEVMSHCAIDRAPMTERFLAG